MNASRLPPSCMPVLKSTIQRTPSGVTKVRSTTTSDTRPSLTMVMRYSLWASRWVGAKSQRPRGLATVAANADCTSRIASSASAPRKPSPRRRARIAICAGGVVARPASSAMDCRNACVTVPMGLASGLAHSKGRGARGAKIPTPLLGGRPLSSAAKRWRSRVGWAVPGCTTERGRLASVTPRAGHSIPRKLPLGGCFSGTTVHNRCNALRALVNATYNNR